MVFGVSGAVSILAYGLGYTVLITVLSAPLAFILAIVAGLGRVSSSKLLAFLSLGYIEVFRGTSLVVQLFYLFYVLPLFGMPLEPVTTGVLALTLNFGAYGAEVVRFAIQAVPRGQSEAAYSLHMAKGVAMRRIIFPQAFPAMLPPFGNLLIELLKATSILSLITITELTFAAKSLYLMTGRINEIYGTVLLVYFVLAFCLTRLMRSIERRANISKDMRKLHVL